MPRILVPYLLTVLICLSPQAHSAQENAPQPKIAPYLTDTTIAFARIRLNQLEFESIETLAKQYLSDNDEVIRETKKLISQLRMTRKQLTDAGVIDVHLVLQLEHFLQGPYLLVDYKQGADPAQIATLFEQVFAEAEFPDFSESEVLGGLLFVGNESVLSRIKAGHIAERPHLGAALAEVEADPLQIVFSPSPDQRRAIREAVPAFPSPYQEVNGESLSQGIQYAVLGVRLEPEPRIRFVISSQNGEVAETLLQAQHRSLTFLAKLTQENMPVPGFGEIVKTLQMSRTDNRLTLTFEAKESTLQPFVQLLEPFVKRQTAVVRASETKNQLKRLGLAMHNWHDVYKVFPAHANYSQDGKPLLSWRVHVLPYLGQLELYKKFHLDEPWDSEHNRQFIAKMPDVYAVPGSSVAKEGKTGFLFPILPDGSGVTTGTKDGIQIQELTDGTSNTAMIVAADEKHSVIWTKPGDLLIDPDKPLDGLFVDPRGAFFVLIGDGSVHGFPGDMDPKMWLKILMRADGTPVIFP